MNLFERAPRTHCLAPGQGRENASGLLASLRELFRDKTRDEHCAALRSMGVDACLAPRGRPEEHTGSGSLGLIAIARSPIRWVNVRSVGEGDHVAEYAVPYQRRPSLHPKLGSVRIRTFPLFGSVVDVRWRGDDGGLGLVERLEGDAFIRAAIMATGDVRVEARPEYGCWIISGSASMNPLACWACYQRVACHLLASSQPAENASDGASRLARGREMAPAGGSAGTWVRC